MSFLCFCIFALNQYFKEYGSSFIPNSDPRHQVVELVVQHLVDKNQDIKEMNSVPWIVHVIDGPVVNAFVMPVSDSGVNE